MINNLTLLDNNDIIDNMKSIIIRNIPDNVSKWFKVHCAETEMTQNEALIRLMEMEVESKILACPVKEKK